jgi:hypothetical protein
LSGERYKRFFDKAPWSGLPKDNYSTYTNLGKLTALVLAGGYVLGALRQDVGEGRLIAASGGARVHG